MKVSFAKACLAGPLAGLLVCVGAGLAQEARAPSATVAERALMRQSAFEAVQQTQQSAAGAALTQVGARFAATKGELGELVRQRQDQIDRWTGLGARIAAAGEGATTLRDERERTGKAIRDLDARLDREFPEFAELSSPRPVSENEAQALLGEDEALILIFSSPGNSYVWAITRTDADWTRVEQPEKEVAGKVKLLRAALDPAGQTRAAQSSFEDEAQSATTGSANAFPRAEAHRLYQLFLQPLESVWRGKKRLNIVASGPLSSLPFGVLVTGAPPGEDTDTAALRQTKWLVRSHALVTLPTVSSFRALRRAAPVRIASTSFRGFGAPRLGGVGDARGKVRSGGQYFRGLYADVEAVRQLASLPETEGELKQLAKALGADDSSVTTGEKATETAVKRADLSKTRVLAFATHGLVAGELEGLSEPALVFTPPDKATAEDDGLLTASEAAQLKLSADWVILSACNTAAGDGNPGAEGLSGLARAFFYAGARALLVSHWPVLDIAAARLTTGTFDELRGDPGIGRAEALRRSMVALIDDESSELLARPMAWAPFVVVGEGL